MALPARLICLVTDRSIFKAGRLPPEARLLDAVSKAVSGGVNMVQLRERGLPSRDLLDLALEVRQITRGKALFTVNDRVDIAIASEADGVQLGEQSISVSAARGIVGDRLLIGGSVHDRFGAEFAEQEGADFLIVGTVFPSRSHPGLLAAGTGLIAEVLTGVGTPVLGIGGITAGNAADVISAGASGVAVIGAILDATEPGDAARRLCRAVALEPSVRVDGTDP